MVLVTGHHGLLVVVCFFQTPLVYFLSLSLLRSLTSYKYSTNCPIIRYIEEHVHCATGCQNVRLTMGNMLNKFETF